jgi:hypothetical protein
LPVENVLNSIRLEGEGRGRLNIDKHQYLFGFESALQENTDWVLAAAIPLHGEEAMTLKNLKKDEVQFEDPDALEARIQAGIDEYLRHQKNVPQNLGQKIIPGFRSLVRLVLATQLDVKKSCILSDKAGNYSCQQGSQSFFVQIVDKEIRIKKVLLGQYFIELTAEDLTDGFFSKNSFNFSTQTEDNKSSPILTFELFWNT